MIDYMTGAELQALREACGLDRDQFGALCGVQGRSIKYWEMGASNRGVPADVADLVVKIEAEVSAEADKQLQHFAKQVGQVVLMRTGNATANQVVSRVYRKLVRIGIEARIVSFDLKVFREWLDSTKGRDTPASRQQWAKLAVKQQARPHKADQPA